ncbi:MAG TPA: sigma-70 family RNA polymerase sigma factor [Urbifossiella sp.]|jgi:RNA polymerase sigma factor (sigma-70 family)|nr:sigma-70 family RNA polymerase sigma factor [Urbifossiella sp.]
MVSHTGAGGVRPFLKLIEVQALRGAADHDLLGRFAAANDEAAFRVIAERHGPMVFGVCARVLGNRHDAEDALQATFLVFARRAAAVRKSESLASWLHGVARRVATRLRRADHRRLARERAATPPAIAAPTDDLAWAEVRVGLDEELGRLPAVYREVLVLCYLEGLTRDEAGQRLGIDSGAVKGRLERGRRLLGERLTRRGIGLSAGLVGLAVVPPAAAAVRLGRLAADPTAASPRATALTHEFLKGVAMSKLKLVTAGLTGVLVLVAGVGMGTAQTPGGPPRRQPRRNDTRRNSKPWSGPLRRTRTPTRRSSAASVRTSAGPTRPRPRSTSSWPVRTRTSGPRWSTCL